MARKITEQKNPSKARQLKTENKKIVLNNNKKH